MPVGFSQGIQTYYVFFFIADAEFKNRIDSIKITQVDFTSPYVQPSTVTHTNEQQTNSLRKKTTEFESITIDDLLKDYEETTQEIKEQSYKKLIGTIFISLIPLIMMLSPYLKKPLKLAIIYFKDLFYILFVQLNNFL